MGKKTVEILSESDKFEVELVKEGSGSRLCIGKGESREEYFLNEADLKHAARACGHRNSAQGQTALREIHPTLVNREDVPNSAIFDVVVQGYMTYLELDRDHLNSEYSRISCALDHATGPNRDSKGIMGY